MNRLPFVKIISFLVITVAVIVMLSQIFDIGVLKNTLSSLGSMQFITAVAFLLSGIVLYLIVLSAEGNGKALDFLLFISIIIFLLMTTLFLSSLIGIRTGIEDFFIKEASGMVKPTNPDQLSIPTMINFILISLAGFLVTYDQKRFKRLLFILGGIIGVIGVATIIGYLLQIPLFYYIQNFNTASTVHTALLFTLIAIALILLSKAELKEVSVVTTIKSRLIIAFLSTSLISTLFLGFISITSSGNALRAELDSNDASALIQAMQFGIGTFTIIILIFTILFAVITANKISQPIQVLNKETDIIAKGNFGYKINIKTGDEIEQVGNAFNQITISLKKSLAVIEGYSRELEYQIEEKTKELTNKVTSLEKTRTAMMNLAEDLEAEKNKTTTILTNIGDGMIVTDEKRKIIYMSRSAEEMLGWSTKDAIDKHISDWLMMEDEKGQPIADEQKPIHLALSTGKKISTTTTTYYFVPKGKERFPAAVTASPVFSGKKIIGAILIFRDITHDLSVDKAKTEFVSLASHQLRTPLSTINWYSEMLLSGDAGKINENQKKYLEATYKASKRMVGLVNSLLNVSRIEIGNVVIEPEPTNPIKIAKICVKELQPQIKEKKLILKEEYESRDLTFRADPKLLGIVFQNLLSNAVKYTPAQGQITLTIKKQIPDLIIKVTDTGIGIPKKQQNRIFEKLFRADNIKEVDTEGTGLGLYLVKAIVNHTGGQISFESQEGKGTTFYVTLPLSGMNKKEGIKELI